MSSLPPKDPSHRQNPAAMLNRFAKRDPQLYPLLAVMVGIVGFSGYFLTRKAATTPDAATHLGQVTNVWEGNGSGSAPGSKTAEWKYRFKNAQGEEKEHENAMANAQSRPITTATNDLPTKLSR